MRLCNHKIEMNSKCCMRKCKPSVLFRLLNILQWHRRCAFTIWLSHITVLSLITPTRTWLGSSMIEVYKPVLDCCALEDFLERVGACKVGYHQLFLYNQHEIIILWNIITFIYIHFVIIPSKREVPRDVRNSKVRRQDKFRRDWSRHYNTCKSQSGTGPGVRRSKRPLLACRTRCICFMETLHN